MRQGAGMGSRSCFEAAAAAGTVPFFNHEWTRMATNFEREEEAFLGGSKGLA